VIHPPKNKREKNDITEIHCRKCQMPFNFQEDILEVFKKRASIYCPHCGFRIWWYELNKDSNQKIISEHQKVINELRNKSDEEI